MGRSQGTPLPGWVSLSAPPQPPPQNIPGSSNPEFVLGLAAPSPRAGRQHLAGLPKSEKGAEAGAGLADV